MGSMRTQARSAGASAGSRLVKAVVEAMEGRQLLSVSLDSGGWTVVTPAADTQIVYVSSSGGNDGNSGLSPESPVASIARGRSLLRNGAGDQLLLKRGDAWSETLGYWKISGASPDQPTVIGAYGEGARPDIRVGTAYAFGAGTPGAPLHDVVISGIHLYAADRDPSSPSYNPEADSDGVYIAGNIQNMLFEDVSIDFFRNNFTVTDYYAPITNFQVRHSDVSFAYSHTAAHSQGLYVQGVHGILLEGNTFDHNGWNELRPGAPATIFNHNAYIQGTNTDFVARGNIFANASSHGLQARVGGDVENNLFLNNAIGLSYGVVNGSGPLVAGGVTGVVRGNVFLGGRDIHGQPRGIGIEIANIKPVDGALVEKNLFADSYDGGLFAAINLTTSNNQFNPDQAVGLNDLTIKDNIVYNWTRGLWVNSAMHNGGTGYRAVNNVALENNDYQSIQSSNIVYHGIGIKPEFETVADNRYSSADLNGAPFYMAGHAMTMEDWSSAVEPSGQGVSADYIDPTRSIKTLSFALGGPGTEEDFLAHARANSKADFIPGYSAGWATAYMRAGFNDTTDSTPAMPGSWVFTYEPLPDPIVRPPVVGGSSGGDGTGGDGTGGTGTGGDGTGGDGSTPGDGTGGTGGNPNSEDGGGGTTSGGTGGTPNPNSEDGGGGVIIGGDGSGTGTGTGGTGTGTGGTGTGTGTGGTGTGTGGSGTGGTGTGTGGTGSGTGGTGTGTGGTGTGTGGTGTGTGGTGTGTGGTGTGTGTGGTGGTVLPGSGGGGTLPDTDQTGGTSSGGTTGGSTGGSSTGGSTTPIIPDTKVETGTGGNTIVIWYSSNLPPAPPPSGSDSGSTTDTDNAPDVTYIKRKAPHIEYRNGYWYLVS